MKVIPAAYTLPVGFHSGEEGAPHQTLSSGQEVEVGEEELA